MMIVNNGAYKSGSTWLFNILVNLTGFDSPPQEFLNPEWKEPSILPARLGDLLNTLKPTDHFLVKNHFRAASERRMLLSHPDVRVFDITRDIRDVVVSSYYHDRRVLNFGGTFEEYYWQIGRNLAMTVLRYNALWARPSKQVYCSSYERLHTDFAAEVTQIAAFLNIAVTPQRIAEIHEETTLSALRQRYGEQDAKEKFFRKGTVGDFNSHMDEKMLADLSNLKRQAVREQALFSRAIRKVKRITGRIIHR